MLNNKLALQKHSHRRLNILNGQWVLVAPHRTQRPWQGQVEKAATGQRIEYDPDCYLCPGNKRASGEVNPDYQHTYIFTNDFTALLLDIPVDKLNQNDLLIAQSERGICRVVCFSPNHSLTLPEMTVEAITKVVDTWTAETLALAARPEINYATIFENKGAMMGCSNPHPHGQIWASELLPNEVEHEKVQQEQYFQKKGSCLLCDYLNLEIQQGERIICENEGFIALVPFWATWPFETLLVSKRHFATFPEMTSRERFFLADILKRLTTRYDNLFYTSFPYSMGFHQAPLDGESYPAWHFHAHFYPPLLRSATIRKFMVGFEMLGTPQRDISPEVSAVRLRELSEKHYLSE